MIAAVVHDQTTTWLAWGSDDSRLEDPPYGKFLHWAEITSGADWDGGQTRWGTAAVTAALRCID